MVAMVIISIIATLCCYGFNSAKINIKQDKFLWVILAMTAYAIFSYHYHGYSSRGLRALLCGSLFLIFLPRQLLSLKLIYAFLFIGSLCSMFMPFYYGEYLNVGRGVWPINAIPQSTLSSAIGLAALVSAIEEKKFERYFMFMAFTFSSIAVIVSESRGLWLGHFTVSSLIFFIKYRRCLLNKKNLLISLALLITSSIVLAPVVESRIGKTQYEIQQIEQGNFNTSIGLRLEMWMMAPQLVVDNVMFGLGSEHQQKFAEQIKSQDVSRTLKRDKPSHYHNQYLDQLVKNGAVGLILLMLLLISPLSSLTKAKPVVRYTVGSVVLLYSIAALTDVPFNHGQTLLLFTILISCIKTIRYNDTYD
ncbi:O-antigen ligase family protein [Photobacterium rosenbergii]|nr:O-antigen ligase family protein [Photobacterium rosenbergii]